MSLLQWPGSSIEYVRKLAHFGLEGATLGRDEFLQGAPVAPFVAEAARQSLAPAAVGLFLGTLGGRLRRNGLSCSPQPGCRALAFGLVGELIGFAAGLIWNTQGLAFNVTRRGIEYSRPLRDERWLERHPINYA